MELEKRLYTYDETAHILALSKMSIRKLCMDGHLQRVYATPSRHRSARIPAESIAAYLEKVLSGEKITLPRTPITPEIEAERSGVLERWGLSGFMRKKV